MGSSTQEQAAKLLDKPSPAVTIKVAKMAAAYYGIFSEEGNVIFNRTILRQHTIVGQSRDNHEQKCNPCMIKSRHDRCLEYI